MCDGPSDEPKLTSVCGQHGSRAGESPCQQGEPWSRTRPRGRNRPWRDLLTHRHRKDQRMQSGSCVSSSSHWSLACASQMFSFVLQMPRPPCKRGPFSTGRVRRGRACEPDTFVAAQTNKGPEEANRACRTARQARTAELTDALRAFTSQHRPAGPEQSPGAL